MLLVLAPLVGMKMFRAVRPTWDATVARELFEKPTSRRLEGRLLPFCRSQAVEGELNIQACDSTSVRVSGSIVRDGLSDSRRVHVNCKKREAKVSILRIDNVHVVNCGNESGHVDLIEIQAPNAMELAFDAGDGVDAKFGRGLDVFPRNHGNVLVEGSEVN